MKTPSRTAAITTLLILALATLSMPAMSHAKYIDGNKRTFTLYCNGVPCAIDSTNRTIYCAVKPTTDDSIKVMFTSSVCDSMSINYRYVKMGDSVKFANYFNKSHRVYFRGSIRVWQMYFTTLPIVLLDARTLVKDTHNEGYFTIIDPMKRTENGECLFIHRAGAKIRGAMAAGLAKKSYAVEFWDDNGNETDFSILGMRSDDDIILDAMYIDKARMRNRVCTDFWNKIDSIPYAEEGETKLNGTQGTFVEVLLNGEYNGLYCLTDKIDRKKLHLKKFKTDPATGKIAQHGLLYKGRAWSSATRFTGYDTSAATNTLYWCDWEQKYPDDADSLAYWTPMRTLIAYAAPDLNTSKMKFSILMSRRFYEQNLINYVLFLNVFHIFDNNCKNTYVSFEDAAASPSCALFTPWDLDASLGRNWDGNKLESFGFDDIISNCGLFKRLIDDGPNNFHRKIHDTWIRWRTTCFSVDSVEAHINAYRDLFISSGAFQREQNKWPGSVVAIKTEAQYMVDWYKGSFEAVNDFLKDYPTEIQDVTSNRNIAVAATTDGMRIRIDAIIDANAVVRIFDTAGTLVETAETTLPYVSNTLTKGIYVVNVEIGGTTVRKKVVVR